MVNSSDPSPSIGILIYVLDILFCPQGRNESISPDSSLLAAHPRAPGPADSTCQVSLQYLGLSPSLCHYWGWASAVSIMSSGSLLTSFLLPRGTRATVGIHLSPHHGPSLSWVDTQVTERERGFPKVTQTPRGGPESPGLRGTSSGCLPDPSLLWMVNLWMVLEGVFHQRPGMVSLPLHSRPRIWSLWLNFAKKLLLEN